MIFKVPPQGASIDSDICIVGSGPLGLTLALECEALGLSVTVLEAGGYDEDVEQAECARAEVLDPRRQAPMNLATRRAFGGASWLWGGRCVPFDSVDYVARRHVPESGWPFGPEEVAPWYGQALRWLFAGQPAFSSPPSRFASGGPDVACNHLERWSARPRLGDRSAYRTTIEASTAIRLHLNSTVCDLSVERGVVSIVVSTGGERRKIATKTVVIAMGGLETTRLLLCAQQAYPDLFGGCGGPLGRYYMGHISGKIANIVFEDPGDVADFDYFQAEDGTYLRRRFMLTEEAQQREGLLNTAFWPDNVPFYDVRHNSGVLSAMFLALAVPAVGRRLMAENIRLGHIGPAPRNYRRHLLNILRDGPAVIGDVYRAAYHRLLATPRKPGFLMRNRLGRYALHFHAEQIPSPESRVTLVTERDRHGMPRLRIDFRFTEQDAHSVVASHHTLDRSLRVGGRARLEYWFAQEDLAPAVLEQATDGVHQVGTTRMGRDPRTSVVAPDLRAHGLANLFVASTSVLPTTGQANPTLTGAALSVRLAHHLKAASVRQRTAA